MGQINFGQPQMEVVHIPEKQGIQKYLPKTHNLLMWGIGAPVFLGGTYMAVVCPKWYAVPFYGTAACAGGMLWHLENRCYFSKRLPYEH